MRTEECRGCRFWKAFGFRETAWTGHCLRRAPIARVDNRDRHRDPEAIFPPMEPSLWCGEFEADPRTVRQEMTRL